MRTLATALIALSAVVANMDTPRPVAKAAAGGCVRTYTGGRHFTHGQLETLWLDAGGDREHADTAAAIAESESGGYAGSYCYDADGTVDRGLWQINSVNGHWSSFDVRTNAEGAVAIARGGADFNAWVTYVSGDYREHLTGTVDPQPVPLLANDAVYTG